MAPTDSMGLFIQPACLQHKYIRHANSSHIFERPERLRAVLLGVAAAVARLEECTEDEGMLEENQQALSDPIQSIKSEKDDLTSLLSSLSIASSSSPAITTTFVQPTHITIIPPPLPLSTPGQILLHHPALQISHCEPPEAPFPYTGPGAKSTGTPSLSSSYMRDLLRWATEAPERIKTTGCEIPGDMGLNQGDLYLGPGSVLAIEGATVCQAIDLILSPPRSSSLDAPSTPPANTTMETSTPPHPAKPSSYFSTTTGVTGTRDQTKPFSKAFCAIRPPGHHCGEDSPSGFCYVNNVVVGAMHAYLEHDVDRAIIIDFDLHHGNGTQALVMPLNAASNAEDIAIKAGKPPTSMRGRDGARRRGWKGFYGSVHDIYSYPCEDGELDLVKDASLSLAAHGQYVENIHLQPYTSEEDFYTRIYPKYLALLDKAKLFMDETEADPQKTVILISAGFDACEHEHQAMQRHDRRVPVSFFSRYTRDIAKFADQHCRGRVVSVLEGGYSDRALTSAAMGHIVGMLGQEGKGEWWNVESLDHIERATKKKRTGKIAPFPSEFSHLPHLSRTHALLAHFETVGLPAEIPSTQTTPQHPPSQRWMTLRARRANGDEDGSTETPPPTARRGRGRGVGTPTATATSTPRVKKLVPSPNKLATSSSAPTLSREQKGKGKAVEVDEVVERMSKVGLVQEVDDRAATREARPLPTAVISTSATVTGQEIVPHQIHTASDHSGSTAVNSNTSTALDATAKPIMLRFKRPQTVTPPPDLGSSSVQNSPLPSPVNLYPPLPQSIPSQPVMLSDRLAYRETSAETSTSGEYVTASSGGEERFVDVERRGVLEGEERGRQQDN